jgi:hypothetical protein
MASFDNHKFARRAEKISLAPSVAVPASLAVFCRSA